MKDQEFIVQKIRTQYTEKQHTELDELKALDTKVKKPAHVFAYTYGSLSAIVMGSGIAAPGTYLEMNERQYPGMGSCRNLFKTGDYLALTLSQEMNIQQPYKRC